MRGDVSSSSAVYTQRGCERARGVRRVPCQLEGEDVPKVLSSAADPFTGPLVILSEYF